MQAIDFAGLLDFLLVGNQFNVFLYIGIQEGIRERERKIEVCTKLCEDIERVAARNFTKWLVVA